MKQGPDGAEDYNRLASELMEIARLSSQVIARASPPGDG